MTENKDNINIRLKKVRIELGLSSGEFSKGAGIDPRNYSSIETGKRAVGERVLRDICSAFPIKLEWLLTGEGNMLKGEVSDKDVSQISTSGRLIPFYDVDAVAGYEYAVNMESARQMGMIEIGSILKDSEAAIRVYGNSMVPNYPAGCVIGTKLHTDSFIEPGRVYVVETRDNRYLKRLYYNDDRTGFHCISDNQMKYDDGPREGKLYYQDFEIPAEEVIRLHRVVGVIKRNIM